MNSHRPRVRARMRSFEAQYTVAKLLVAGVSLAAAVMSYSVAGSSIFGTFAATMAACSLSGAAAGGWIAQGFLRYQALSSTPLTSLLGGRPAYVAGIAVPSVAGASVGAHIAVDAGSTPQVAILATGLITVLFAVISIDLGRAMVAGRPVVLGITEMLRAVSLTGAAAIEPWSRSLGMRPLVGALCVASVLLAVSSTVVRSSTARVAVGDGASVRRLARYGAPLGVWILLSGLYQNLDRILIERLATPDEAGRYALVYDVANRGLLLPVTALAAALHVRVLGSYERSGAAAGWAANRRIVRAQRCISAASVPLVGAVAWFVSAHSPSVGQVGAVTGVIVFVAGLVWADAISVQREIQGGGYSLVLLAALGGAVLTNVVLNLLLIPTSALLGAASATLASAAIYDAAVILRARRERPA